MEAHDALEERVRQRTAQLAAANEALQALFEPAAPTVAEPAPPQPLADIRTKPLSKRDFLRGRFLPGKQA